MDKYNWIKPGVQAENGNLYSGFFYSEMVMLLSGLSLLPLRLSPALFARLSQG